MQELVRKVREEMAPPPTGAAQPGAGGKQESEEDPCFEVVATVLEIFGRMDSLVSLIILVIKPGADVAALILVMHFKYAQSKLALVNCLP